MIEKIISPGNKIEFTKVNSYRDYDIDSGKRDDNTYISQVCDVIDEYRVKIAIPIQGGKVVPIPQNVRIDVCFFTAKGLYQGRAVVVDRFKENSMFVMIIEMMSDLQKYQRRQFFRLNCAMDIMYRTLTEEETEEYIANGKLKEQISDDSLYYNAIALDISGGGIRFATAKKIQENSYIFINMKIAYGEEEKKTYNLAGKVISSTISKNRKDIYECRVEYCNMSGEIREQIIKYIFEQERKMRKKENSL